jgi:hypothetical protein
MVTAGSKSDRWWRIIASVGGMALSWPFMIFWLALASLDTASCSYDGQPTDRPTCTPTGEFMAYHMPFYVLGVCILSTLVGGGVAVHLGHRPRPWITGSWSLFVLSLVVAFVAGHSTA